MTRINAYLNLNGNCRQAMNFYKDCLGGELELQTVAESPMASQMPLKVQQQVLHSTLKKGDIELMASDMSGDAFSRGNEIALALTCSSPEEIRTFFDKLSVGSTATMPLDQAPWGGTYGEITDKYGIRWLLNYDKNAKDKDEPGKI